MENMDLSVAMIRARHTLRSTIEEIRRAVPLPPYIISSILSDIQNELKNEEKELLLNLMILEQEKLKQSQKEEGENAEGNILHND